MQKGTIQKVTVLETIWNEHGASDSVSKNELWAQGSSVLDLNSVTSNRDLKQRISAKRVVKDAHANTPWNENRKWSLAGQLALSTSAGYCSNLKYIFLDV